MPHREKPGTASAPTGAPDPEHHKRFYEEVAVAPEPAGGGFTIQLDGRPVRTPGKALMTAPTRALAEAIAEEWRGQGARLDPRTMPLTRMANTTLDGVTGREAQVRADILGYAESDLTCYFAEGPRGLVELQRQGWGAVHAWAQSALGARFAQAAGVMPVTQPRDAIASVESRLAEYGPFELAALHVMTALTGSTLLALAHAAGEIPAERAWELAHIDEDWQTSQWGEDADAAARRAAQWAEMEAACRLYALSREVGAHGGV